MLFWSMEYYAWKLGSWGLFVVVRRHRHACTLITSVSQRNDRRTLAHDAEHSTQGVTAPRRNPGPRQAARPWGQLRLAIQEDHFPAAVREEHLPHLSPKTGPGPSFNLPACLWLTPSLEALSLSVLLSSASFSGDPDLGKGHKKHLNPDVPALPLFILGSHELGPRTAHGSGNNHKP